MMYLDLDLHAISVIFQINTSKPVETISNSFLELLFRH